MNTKLLALTFLLNKNPEDLPAAEEDFRKELAGYTTEGLFKLMVETDKNWSFDPESIFEIIKERGDDAGRNLIYFLSKVHYQSYNSKFKQELCTALLHRNDYTIQALKTLFYSHNSIGDSSVLGSSFIDNQSLVFQKLTLCTIDELAELSDTPVFFRNISEMARKIAEKRLTNISTDRLLELLHKGTKINVGKELKNRTEDLMRLAL